MNRRGLLAVFAAVAFGLMAIATPARAADAEDAAGFVDTVIHEAFSALAGQKLNREERTKILAGLLERYVNFEKTSQDLLGRSWAVASEADQATFRKTLFAYMLALWSAPMGDVSPGQAILVKSAEPRGEKFLVHSIAMSPGEDPTPVEWIVGSADDRFFVSDVSIEGVSLIRVMKSDFTSVLFANSGRLGGLIAGMQKKIQSVN